MQSLARQKLRLRSVLRIRRAPERPRPAADPVRVVPSGRAPARLGWAPFGLLVASAAVPLLLFALAAWQNYRLVQLQATQQVTNTTAEMREQALRVFETYTLVLKWVVHRAQGLSWGHIEHDRGFHRFLVELDDLPQIDAVRIIDASGRVRASGRLFPVPPENVSDRDYFIAHKAARRPPSPYIGSDHLGTLTHSREFDISRRLRTPDGSFGGIVTISAKPSYFRDFYGTISHAPGFAALLVRSDGTVLVRYPTEPKSPVLSRDSTFMRALASGRNSGVFHGKGINGIERIYGYRRVPGYPIYVVFGIPTADVLAAWGANLITYALFAVPASIGLFLLTLFALRQLQWRELFRWRWQTTAQKVRREMRKREMAEEELRQAQKMESLGQLTGSVAHDFNNLLAIIQVSLEMLKGRQANDRLEAKVGLALETVDRGEKLTGQLLAFSRRHPLRVESVDVNARLSGMTELLARAVDRAVTIETDLAPDLARARIDANQFELAVMNVAINARDAMPHGGVLHIRTGDDARHLLLPEELAKTADAFIVIEISDTGCGMPPEVLARAFEPFFTTKEPGKGTGLGLSTVYGFARQSGGTALIRSTLGRGTTVILVLPKSRPPAFAENGAERLPAAGSA
jgi:two-component system NtrC family sensor kinase